MLHLYSTDVAPGHDTWQKMTRHRGDYDHLVCGDVLVVRTTWLWLYCWTSEQRRTDRDALELPANPELPTTAPDVT